VRQALALASSVLAAAGLIVSGYLLWEALITPAGSCPLSLSPFFGCSVVLASSYSRIAGLPTSILGVGWFLVALGLSLAVLRNPKLGVALLVWSLIGLVGVVWLMYIEFVVIGAICPFCTSAHILELGVLVIAIFLWRARRPEPA
jgi:uncharacterized membrane protein